MGVAGIAQYNVYFADSGSPKSGLSPIAVLRNRDTNEYVSGIVVEEAHGFYTLYTSGVNLVDAVVVGYVDGGDPSLANSDRFIPVALNEYDYGVDGFVSDIPALTDTQLSSTHGAGDWTSSGGSGVNAVTLSVVDTLSAPIAGVMVNVYNATETTLVSYGTTDSLGSVGFLLNDGTYKVRLAKFTSYTFSNPQTLTVAGTTTATYTGTPISGPMPPTAETCVVSGRCLDGDGNVIEDVHVSAKVIGSLVTYQDLSDNITSVASQPLTTVSDANGVWYLTLIRSAYLYDSGGDSGVQYRFRLKGRGMDENKDATIPNTVTAKYEEL